MSGCLSYYTIPPPILLGNLPYLFGKLLPSPTGLAAPTILDYIFVIKHNSWMKGEFVQTEEDAWHGDEGVKSSYWQSVVWVLTRPKRSKLHSNLHDDHGLFPFYFSFELKHAVVNPKSRVNWNKKTSAVSYGHRGQILSLKQEIKPPRVVSNADPQSTARSFVLALVYVKYLNPIPRPMFRMSVIGTFCVLKKCNCVADLVRIKMVYANCAVLKFPPRLLLVAQSSNLHAKWKCCFFGCIFLRSMDDTVF